MAIDGAGERQAPIAASAGSGAAKGLRWLLIAGAISLPMVSALAPAAIAWVLLAHGAAAAIVLWPRLTWPQPARWPVAVILAAFLAWGLGSALWSIQPAETAWRAGKLAALLAAALLTFAALRQSNNGVRTALALGLAIAAAYIFFEVPSDMAAGKVIRAATGGTEPEFLFFYNRGASVFALAVWPAVAGLVGAGRRWQAFLCMAAAVACVFLLDSDAARIGIVAGLIICGLTLLRPAAASLLLILGMATWILAAPIVAAQLDPAVVVRLVPNIQPSHLHRVLIWKFAAARALERPIAGWGLGASRSLPEGTVNLRSAVDALPMGPEGDELKLEFAKATFEQMPLHPHSITLQVWIELGAVGAAFLLAAIAIALVAARRRYAGADLAAFHGLLVSFLVIANFSYGAWQSWWLAALALALLLLHAGASAPNSPDHARERRR